MAARKSVHLSDHLNNPAISLVGWWETMWATLHVIKFATSLKEKGGKQDQHFEKCRWSATIRVNSISPAWQQRGRLKSQVR